jgi:glycosyltransferase involved in cell wall biosynthesis
MTNTGHSEMPFLSIVIPTRIENDRSDRIEVLNQVLTRLLKQSLSLKHYEVVIIDDGSDADIAAALGLPLASESIRLARQGKGGPSVARNFGTRLARGKVVLYLGDDVLVRPNLLEEHLRTHKHFSDVAVINAVHASDRSILGKEVLENHVDGLQDGVRYPMPTGSAFCTSCVSIAKHWMELTPFDERFPYPAYEDSEVGYRLHKQGVGFAVATRTSAIHDHVHSVESLRRRSRNCGRSFAYARSKHPNWQLGINHEPGSARTRISHLGYRFLEPLATRLSSMGPLGSRTWALNMLCKYEFLAGAREGLPCRQASTV